jgi:hypothetical protein
MILRSGRTGGQRPLSACSSGGPAAAERSNVMSDRFTIPSVELAENNPYRCDSCTATYGHPTFAPLPGGHEPAAEMRDAGCLYNCDPMPFGD